ncbi:hypothetical protein ASPACDRAFT_45490 [Aspergillus aculeatus ATCC 16872]|uniref:NmrA-like domain-containing protein n=1 Tax=Aspergillus aculeatus (strain ATCC 16872 / CBS 172.66 / WB 5094) TaxID=690307 RepID=A0A1L9WMK1_ASPA1|nr:uncharacterized protein ASPACDRAFT_45490 [Aspergillus aculeatus ATCC 16872]OJJ97399.1 hypothetical protein ASPACDRAFT_45490 [Aspergillus aculeatus ATCC 16872]
MPNRIAVYGHRGWVGSAIVQSLSESPAVVKVLYRPESNARGLPPNVIAVQVDITDEEALVSALQDVDILISLVGHSAIECQYDLIRALPKTKVQLFVPSDLAVKYRGQGLGIELISAKIKVEEAAERLGVPTTVVLTGNFAEFALDTPAKGVDHRHNRIIFTGNSASQPLNLCTREYVAAAFASIFSTTPIRELQNRTLSLSELTPTGDEVAQALANRFGATPAKHTVSLEEVTRRVDAMIEANNPLALCWYTRKNWGNGDQLKFLGSDMWEVEGYEKKSIEDLLVAGKLGKYRALPEEAIKILEAEFVDCK